MNRLLIITLFTCFLPALALAQGNQPQPLKLLILDHPKSTGQPNVLARVLKQSPNIQRMDAKSFWAKATIAASTFKSEASIKKAQPALAQVMTQQGIETIFVWRNDAKGSTIWVIGPAGKWRGQVGKVWSTGLASQTEVQALLKQGFGLSAPVVLAWRKQQKHAPRSPKIAPEQPKEEPKLTPKTTANNKPTTEEPTPPKTQPQTQPKTNTPEEPTKADVAKNSKNAKDKTPREPATPKAVTAQGDIKKQAQPKSKTTTPGTILNVHLSPSFRRVNETAAIVDGTSRGDAVPQQTLLGISAGLSVAIFLSPTIALQPRLDFNYHTGEVATAGRDAFANMNMTDTELMMDVFLAINSKHQITVGLGSLISRWSFLELYPNTLMDTFTASALLDINYNYWAIEQFMVLRLGTSAGLPAVGKYGPTSQQLNSAMLTRARLGISVRVLNWLWLNSDINSHFQFNEYSIFPPDNPAFPTTIKSDWTIMDLKLGLTGVW